MPALGTGGVAIFALEIAKLAGARAIITSSSDVKPSVPACSAPITASTTRPRRSGTDGARADGPAGCRSRHRDGRRGTLPRLYVAVAPGGTVSVIGVMTRPEGDLSRYPPTTKGAMVRGIFVGAREHSDGLMKAVAVDPPSRSSTRRSTSTKLWKPISTSKAAQYFGKVVIKI